MYFLECISEITFLLPSGNNSLTVYKLCAEYFNKLLKEQRRNEIWSFVDISR